MKLVIRGCDCEECEAHFRIKAAMEAADRYAELRRRQNAERPKAPVIDIFQAFAIRATRRKA